MVQVIGDVIALPLADVAHAGAFGQVLPEQSVEVFIAPVLPGMIWGGKVDGDREALF